MKIKLNLPPKACSTALFDAAGIIEQLAPKNAYYAAKVREMRKIASADTDLQHRIAAVLDYCDDQESCQQIEFEDYGASLASARVRQILAGRKVKHG